MTTRADSTWEHFPRAYIINIYFNVIAYSYHWWSIPWRLGFSTCKYDLKHEDLEFLMTNKITKIINCAAKYIPNYWEFLAIKYLSY